MGNDYILLVQPQSLLEIKAIGPLSLEQLQKAVSQFDKQNIVVLLLKPYKEELEHE